MLYASSNSDSECSEVTKVFEITVLKSGLEPSNVEVSWANSIIWWLFRLLGGWPSGTLVCSFVSLLSESKPCNANPVVADCSDLPVIQNNDA